VGYSDCDVDELKKFAVDRGLVTKGKKPSKRLLVDALMEADRKRTFPKFFELSAELRKFV
jgi:hypothetical protein